MFDSLRPHGLYSPWNSPGQNTGVGSLSLLQGIFLTQGLNPGLQHSRQILYRLSHQGRPRQCKTVPFYRGEDRRSERSAPRPSSSHMGGMGTPGCCVSSPPHQCLLHRLPGAAEPAPRTPAGGAASSHLICVRGWEPGLGARCWCREGRLASVCTPGTWPFPLSSQVTVRE